MRKNFQRNVLLCISIFILGTLLFSSCDKVPDESGLPKDIDSLFYAVPDSVKLSVYWYWINGNISKEGVTKDLIAMNKAGIGRAFIGNIGLDEPHGDSTEQVTLFSEEWWAVLGQAFKVADSLGIEIGMFNSPGWSQSGGPWVKKEEAMRYLASYPMTVNGPKKIKENLKVENEDFQRTAVLAFPTPAGEKINLGNLSPKINASGIENVSGLIDDDTGTEASFKAPSAEGEPATLTIDLEKVITARSLVIHPGSGPFKADVELKAKVNGAYHSIKKFGFNRTNSADNVGFIPNAPVVVSFEEIKSKSFQLIFSHYNPGGNLSEIELSPHPYLERYYEKQLAKMFQTPLPLWGAYLWDNVGAAVPDSFLIKTDEVLNITSSVSAEGILDWEVPEGEWTILQLGMQPTGVTNAPATPEATGLEVDKMNKKHLKSHFDGFIGEILSHFPAEDRKAFKVVVADSYETGSETWTDGFAEDFEKEYGYDPLPWLPVLSGNIVDSEDQSNRFLWDLRRLIADRVAYDYVGELRKLSHEHGLTNWLENYGHWGFPAEFLQYGGQSDEIGGEFWAEGELGSIELKDASSAVHIYGKNKVYAESFTAGGRTFERYPADIKARGDWAFTEGVNSTLLHVYISQPKDDPKPGINAWFGTEFNRNNTWFEMEKPFFDYLRRCNFMLQQGNPVGDVAYFIGEDAPKMTGIQDPELPGGYSYDWINAEVILNRLSVKNGDLTLPNGISYKMLVLPPQTTMRPRVLKKIKELIEEGATVLGPPPHTSPSLQDYPEADKKIQEWAGELWPEEDRDTKQEIKYGKGRILNGMDMEEALSLLGVIPDFEAEADLPILFTHRRTKDADIYFISNQSDSTVTFAPSFRVSGKQPEWWDAVDGSVRILPQFEQKGNATTVPLRLEDSQSGFLVFRKEAKETETAGNNFPDTEEMWTITGPWEVKFDESLGGPAAPVIFENLGDWSNRPEEDIKYYSGSAVYSTIFRAGDLPKDREIYVDLGTVEVIAEVKLNGEKVGEVWTAPERLKVTDYLKEGENELEIKVVNTWMNRLIGDKRLPEKERLTRTDVNPYTPDSPLQRSGLLGPVTIQLEDN